MTIYLLTNRTVVKAADGSEHIDEHRPTVVEPTFRVGEVDLDNKRIAFYPDLIATTPVEKRARAGSNQLFRSLVRATTASKRDLLMFVHGFDYSLADNFDHMQRLQQLYVQGSGNVADMLYVAWPSDGAGLSASSYRADRRDARDTGIVLARVFHKLVAFIERVRAHAQCNRRVLLLNADVGWGVFEADRPFTRLAAIASRVHVYMHRGDDALVKSRSRFDNEQRLGWRGPSNLNALPPEVFVVDATGADTSNPDVPLKERIVDHWGYLHREHVQRDIRAVLRGEDEDDIDGRTASAKYPRFFSL